jgi:transposase InsO family protein
MPWRPQDLMSTREEFVALARQAGANRRSLCRRFGISPQTGYKWLARFAEEGSAGLADRSRRPHRSPRESSETVQAQVIAVRQEHPAWGARKISRRLKDLDQAPVAPSTVTAILHRHGLIDPAQSEASAPWTRFEREAPNALWQADFKGHFATAQGRCSPLTVLDDHSRFNVALAACGDTTTACVRAHFEAIFRRYGLPVQINFDNGAPWGAPKAPGQITELAVWLVQLGIRVSHSRPYHPQTNGKDERFHRSLKAEVLNGVSFESLAHVQRALDRWRHTYNHERPHDALGLATPVSRYRISSRPFPEQMPAIEYAPDDQVQRVGWCGELRFRGVRYKLSSALSHRDVAIRPRSDQDGVFDVFFAHHRCLTIELRTTEQQS